MQGKQYSMKNKLVAQIKISRIKESKSKSQISLLAI